MRVPVILVMAFAAIGQAAVADPDATAETSEADETLAVMNRPPVPQYPTRAISRGLQGFCVVTFDVNAKGWPENIRAACTDKAFCNESRRALSRVTFSLKTDEAGEPVPVKDVTYPLEYRLGGRTADKEAWGKPKACS